MMDPPVVVTKEKILESIVEGCVLGRLSKDKISSGLMLELYKIKAVDFVKGKDQGNPGAAPGPVLGGSL
jgi:hypothetical protein